MRYNRNRYNNRTSNVPRATAQELAQNKQVLVAKVDYLDTFSRLFQFVGPAPQQGDVAVFFLNVVRGKPTATVFVVPPGGNKDMLATEIRVTSTRIPHDAQPIVQYRSLCFYRAALTVLEMLRKTAPEDRGEMLHYMKCFELHIKQCVRTGRLTPAVLESKWRKYVGVRELYLRPATEGESNAARQGVLRVVRQFLTITT
jgi:hypothetical protein